jgi:hypothetical protein
MSDRPEQADNGRENGPLTPKREAAALALAAGATHAAAARKAGCGERTIRTWQAERPEFARRVAQLRSEMSGRACGRLAAGMAAGADTLRALLKARSEQVRLGAARALLELGVKVRESVELEARIRALEER